MDDRTKLSDIERALADALDVDVSADFHARVRRRIASEPAPPPFWHRWHLVLPAAAAAIVIVGAGLATRSTAGRSAPSLLPARPLAAALRPAEPRTIHPALARATVPVRHSPVQAASATPEPEVLVPRAQIEMYRQLIAKAGQMPPAVVVEAPQDVATVGMFSEITIDPIRIDLIVPPAGGEGDRQ